MDLGIERLASSVVREFLSRKKCTETLKQMDQEWPRDECTVSNRTKLAQALCIESWVKKNKAEIHPLKTMLEVILYNVLLINKTQCKTSDVLLVKEDSLPEKYTNLVRPSTTPAHTRTHKKPQLPNYENMQVEDVKELTINDLDDFNPASKSSWTESNDHRYHEPGIKKPADMQRTRPFESIKVGVDNLNVSTEQEAVFKQHEYNTVVDGVQENKIEALHSDSLLEFLSNSSENAEIKDSVTIQKFQSDSNFLNKHKRAYKRQGLESNPIPFDLKLNQQAASNNESRQPKNLTFDYETAKDMRKLIFGSSKFGFSTEWTDQAFAFHDCKDRTKKLRFGIVQKKGGPCGVLALVQGMVLKHMLFSEANFPLESDFNVNDFERTNYLSQAIAEILWRACDGSFAALAILSPRKQFTGLPHEYKPDGLSEYISILNFSCLSDLQTGVNQHIKSFEHGRGSCILLLYSAILTRGIKAVMSDLDETNGKLMGAHGYCTQEMINLLCIGRATSNAFNGSIKLDESTLLRGVHHQSDIGLLSLFEHYRSCQIGSYYKSPKYPIWLVCSESHFTVLFGLDRNLISDESCPNRFDLYYYDELANQDELIRLSIDTSSKVSQVDLIGDLVPPLEHCIRTKWPRASIDWNETDPIL